MSDWHALTMHEDSHEIQVVFHFTIPNENNFAGRNKRDVVKAYLESQSEDGTIASQYPFITTGAGSELEKMQAGEVYEHVGVVKFSANLTKVQKQNEIDSRWTSLNTNIINRLDAEFDFYGHDRDVP